MKIIPSAPVRRFAGSLAAAFLIAATCAFSAQAADGAQRLSASERNSVQRVITLQMKAFQRDDEGVAFSYSSAETRRQFGSPRNFMEMVRAEYSVLYRHLSREFLETEVQDDQVIQRVRIVSREGEAFIATYTLERQADHEWRIAGCELEPSDLLST